MGTTTTAPDTAQPTREDLFAALLAVRESIDIPHAATVGEQEIRDRILIERSGHAVAMLNSILSGKGWLDVPWDVAYLRARLAEHPATGYKTWDERVTELEAAKGGDR